MSSDQEDEKYYLLPHEDGSTIIFSFCKKLDDPDVHVDYRYEETSSHIGEDIVDRYLEFFPEEAKLKVALFEEMLRTVPVWMEDNEPWYRELCLMASRGINYQKKSRTYEENVVLEWVLLAVTDPKVRLLHQNSVNALLELTKESRPMPSKAFLLEYMAERTNDVSYGFLPSRPGDVFALVFNFGEAGRGKCFSRSLKMALALSGGNFSLWGNVSPRYKCLLMVEFLSHPGVVPVEGLRERSSSSGLLQNPGLHKIEDTASARIMAILLYEEGALSPPRNKYREIALAGIWAAVAIHIVYAIHRLRRWVIS